jgi:hypothetical protein
VQKLILESSCIYLSACYTHSELMDQLRESASSELFDCTQRGRRLVIERRRRGQDG